jgi:hypothetical protein
MKKLISLLFWILMVKSNISAQCNVTYDYDFLTESDLEKRGLEGDVEKVIYSHFEVINSFGEISKGTKSCEQHVIFNRDGSVNKIIEYNSNGEIVNTKIHEYENGKINFISSYDDKGNLGNKIAFISEGKAIREQSYDSKGVVNNQYFLRTYGINGNILTEEWKYHKIEKWNQTSLTKYFYNSNNRLSKITTNDTKICTLTFLNQQSKFPNRVDCQYFDAKTKKIERTKIIEFDSKNNIIKKYSRGKLLYSYDYIYDEKGNWIERISFHSEAKIPDEITERQIIYFE